MQPIDFIGIHWGSTSFRAWAMSWDGTVIDTLSADRGLKSVSDRAYESAVMEVCGAWLEAASEAPLVICGMSGARGGWVETPYAPCPVWPEDLPSLAAQLSVAGRPAFILPGAVSQDADGHLDVMRGEEVQILGTADLCGVEDASICIPGTHNKWADLKGGALRGFRTFVTGELFGLLRSQSLVGAVAEGDEFDRHAFVKGVRRGASAPLAHAVFAARADALNGALSPTSVSAFLSGILIGAEICAQDGEDQVILLSSPTMQKRYELAFDQLDRSVRTIDPTEATRRGLVLAAREILPEPARP